MRFYLRTSRNSGVSVGVVGGVALLFAVAAVWFYAAVIAGVLLLAAGAYVCAVRAGRRDFLILLATLGVVAVLAYWTIGVTPWGLVAEAWRTVFGTNTPA